MIPLFTFMALGPSPITDSMATNSMATEPVTATTTTPDCCSDLNECIIKLDKCMVELDKCDIENSWLVIALVIVFLAAVILVAISWCLTPFLTCRFNKTFLQLHFNKSLLPSTSQGKNLPIPLL